MNKYKIVRLRHTAQDTENMLNALAMDGWVVICSYAYDNEYLILEKEEKR